MSREEARLSMDLPKDFFTAASMATFVGSTGAVLVVVNGLKMATGWHPAWLGLIVAQIIVNAGVYGSGGQDFLAYLVGVVNGFLVYLTAGGATGAAGAALDNGIHPQGLTQSKDFFSAWW